MTFRTSAKTRIEMRIHLRSYVTIDFVSGCWNWTNKPAKPNGRRYPYVKWQGRYQKASRVVLIVFKGLKMEGFSALHRCDNSWCICPEHLYRGNQSRNMLDCVKRGRHKMANKTRCLRGHELSRVIEGGIRRRRCLQCHKIANREYWRRKHGKE